MSDSPPAPKPKTGSIFDRTAAIAAIIISLTAMLVSLLEVNTSRAQQRAAVWPYMEVVQSYQESGYQLVITNKGVGPALLGDIVLLYENEPVTNLDQLIIDTVGPEKAFSYERYRSTDPSGRVMAPGESNTLFGVDWDPVSRELLTDWNGKVDIQTCYCSINRDCWTVSYINKKTEPVKACEITVRP
ncbi:MAG: hypothetical protein AAFX02_08225 [Pseudomonadota bacterium]